VGEVAVRYFSDLEAATLTAVYDAADAFWEFLWQLSDAVAERDGEVAADGVRWLCRWRQRPEWLPNFHRQRPWQWWTDESRSSVLEWKEMGDFENHLPFALADVCRGYGADAEIDRSTGFASAVEGLVAFVDEWCRLSEADRRRLWAEWVSETAVAGGVR
jgi:hypothetical protein